MNLDQQTMFTINALLLVVFAIAFSFAGLGAKDRTYWLYMVASNIVLAVAFFMFSQEMGGTANSIILPNLLLFVGLSFRWIAIRVFFSHSVPLKSQLYAAALFGAIILVAADLLERILIIPWQVPAGLLSALIGGPYFLTMMWKKSHC